MTKAHTDCYTYAYLREDGTPYYIGRGRDRRALKPHTNVKVPPKERILFLKKDLTVEESKKHEIYMIAIYGRKDKGGILVNFTDGGEGTYGYTFTPEQRKKMSEAQKGKTNTPESNEKRRIASTGKSISPEAQRRKVLNNPTRKPITLERISTGEHFTFESMAEACRKFNLQKSNMSQLYHGKQTVPHKGFKIIHNPNL